MKTGILFERNMEELTDIMDEMKVSSYEMKAGGSSCAETWKDNIMQRFTRIN